VGDAERQCASAGRRSLEARSPDLRHFQALSTPEQNPALKVLSTPAHPQVTQTVETVEKFPFQKKIFLKWE
jgi:hypothetical protein